MTTTTTFETAKIGDKVWDIKYGWGEVIDTYEEDKVRLRVLFKLVVEKYTFEGVSPWSDSNARTLFWDKVEVVAPPKPLPNLAVDTKVLVWGSVVKSGRKLKRYFSHFDEKGRICVFEYGATSWSGEAGAPWEYWELAE